jgi:hypothetical protein
MVEDWRKEHRRPVEQRAHGFLGAIDDAGSEIERFDQLLGNMRRPDPTVRGH